ncbi:MAG TPA: HAMP domain-containing sensor histidine kinase [Gemmatimonadaceae bacterium]|nr:HAMP domain-containing sensor histidine kinase [Gemmatimonadaceae bacterium]
MRTLDRPQPVAPAPASGAPRRPWTPLAPVAVGLLALTILDAVPWATSRRMARVRSELTETIVPAQRIVRAAAQAVVLEVAARDELVARRDSVLARSYGEAVATVRASDSALGVLAPRLTAGGVARDVARLRATTARWRTGPDAGAAGVGAGLADVLATAARLDTALGERERRQLERLEALEAWSVRLPTALVPLLVGVLLAVYWTGRRMAALAREAERSRVALAAASEHKIALLRGLTHDLKNALGAAGGYAVLLRDGIAGPLTPLQRDYATRIGRIIDRTFGAVQDALSVARSEAASLRVRQRRADLGSLVLEAASDYFAAAERAGLTLSVTVAEDVPPVDTDPSLVSKIIGNLLSNAIKYTPADGSVALRTSYRPARTEWGAGPWVAVEVIDSGPGVPPALQGRIFDEFFRVPTTAATASGDGIGLAMSRRVARLLGGEITCVSVEGRGTTFTLWLPVHAPARRAAAEVNPPASPQRTHQPCEEHSPVPRAS